MSNNCYLLFIIAIIGVALVIRWIGYIKKARAVGDWVQTSATITNATVGQIEQPEVYVKIEYFFPKVNYSYKVGELIIESSQYCYDEKGWWSQDRKSVELLINNINKNPNTIAYYDPNEITCAVLARNVSKTRRAHYRGVLGAGIVVFMIGVVLSILICY